ncbi:MAG TPA: FAD-dependent oxidoreductase [Geminicoccaceae bacterium]|nr:FAD-dependent oxidoreductase [Geminicoccus sp.]HMU51192.1 FAD-dependent oxidoreductase [Geminicoccaceae bacterium]
MSVDRVVIVGAGQAGAQVAISLRQGGFAGSIVLLGDEPDLPYQRPPLSKKFLTGEVAADRAYVKPPAFYEQSRIEVALARRVAGIDRAAGRVIDDEGSGWAYDALVLCMGTRVRRLAVEGGELPGVRYLRTMADARDIRGQAVSAGRAVVVGGGYIGLEVAASLRHLGAEVTVLEAQERVMNRVVAEPVSRFFTDEHRRHGVEILTGAGVAGFRGRGHVEAVAGSDGQAWPADLVVVGVGAVPNDELAREAGLEVANGIVVDGSGRTSDPAVWAAGDVTNLPSGLFDRRLRLESVHNAMAQAKAVAASILGRPEVYDDVPWFWSDQYDIKLQIAGLSVAGEEVLLRGDPASRAFSCLYTRNGRLMALDAINRPADFIMAKRLIAERRELDPARAADPAIKLGD